MEKHVKKFMPKCLVIINKDHQAIERKCKRRSNKIAPIKKFVAKMQNGKVP